MCGATGTPGRVEPPALQRACVLCLSVGLGTTLTADLKVSAFTWVHVRL